MLIDWFTIGAQALNFLILVWLLKHFLYKPILNAIDAREKKIAAELAGAATAKADAQKDRDEFQKKNQTFDADHAALMSKATDDAKAERQHLLDEAHKAADAVAAKQHDAMQTDADNLRASIARRAQQEVFAIAREALTDLAGTSLEQQMTDVFTRRLGTMNSDDKKRFGEALKSSPTPSVVRTAFDLPQGPRAAIQKSLNETFSAAVPLSFQTAPELVGGIELSAGGQKLAWSISDYLSSLQNGIEELVRGPQSAPQTAPPPRVSPTAPKPVAKAS